MLTAVHMHTVSSPSNADTLLRCARFWGVAYKTKPLRFAVDKPPTMSSNADSFKALVIAYYTNMSVLYLLIPSSRVRHCLISLTSQLYRIILRYSGHL